MSRPSVESAHEGAGLLSDSVSKLRCSFELLSRDVQKLIDREATSDVPVIDKMKAIEEFSSQTTQAYTDTMVDLTSKLSGYVMALLAEKF